VAGPTTGQVYQSGAWEAALYAYVHGGSPVDSLNAAINTLKSYFPDISPNVSANITAQIQSQFGYLTPESVGYQPPSARESAIQRERSITGMPPPTGPPECTRIYDVPVVITDPETGDERSVVIPLSVNHPSGISDEELQDYLEDALNTWFKVGVADSPEAELDTAEDAELVYESPECE
jgi:hypothetical protein